MGGGVLHRSAYKVGLHICCTHQLRVRAGGTAQDQLLSCNSNSFETSIRPEYVKGSARWNELMGKFQSKDLTNPPVRNWMVNFWTHRLGSVKAAVDIAPTVKRVQSYRLLNWIDIRTSTVGALVPLYSPLYNVYTFLDLQFHINEVYSVYIFPSTSASRLDLSLDCTTSTIQWTTVRVCLG